MDDEKLERFERAANRLIDNFPYQSSQSTINVNAGGAAVWIATTACAIMLSVNIVLFTMLMDNSRKIERMQDYISAIYAQAPQLKGGKKDGNDSE